MTSLRGRSYTREPCNLGPTVVLIVRGGLENAQPVHGTAFCSSQVNETQCCVSTKWRRCCSHVGRRVHRLVGDHLPQASLLLASLSLPLRVSCGRWWSTLHNHGVRTRSDSGDLTIQVPRHQCPTFSCGSVWKMPQTLGSSSLLRICLNRFEGSNRPASPGNSCKLSSDFSHGESKDPRSSFVPFEG